jgi:hypothetical protein
VGLTPPLLYNLNVAGHRRPSSSSVQRALRHRGRPGIGQDRGYLSLLLIGFGGGNEAEGGANPLQGTLVASASPSPC